MTEVSLRCATRTSHTKCGFGWMTTNRSIAIQIGWLHRGGFKRCFQRAIRAMVAVSSVGHCMDSIARRVCAHSGRTGSHRSIGQANHRGRVELNLNAHFIRASCRSTQDMPRHNRVGIAVHGLCASLLQRTSRVRVRKTIATMALCSTHRGEVPIREFCVSHWFIGRRPFAVSQ